MITSIEVPSFETDDGSVYVLVKVNDCAVLVCQGTDLVMFSKKRAKQITEAILKMAED